MNIFFLHTDPILAGQWLCDAHGKMVLETGQMMSTCVNVLLGLPKGQQVEGGYKTTHKNHPCNVWIRESIANFEWVAYMALACNEERVRRGFKHHKTTDVIEYLFETYSHLLPDRGLTKVALTMPDICKDEDPVLAYRTFYNLKPHLMEVDCNYSCTKNLPEWLTNPEAKCFNEKVKSIRHPAYCQTAEEAMAVLG